jgi:hypothetical protein
MGELSRDISGGLTFLSGFVGARFQEARHSCLASLAQIDRQKCLSPSIQFSCKQTKTLVIDALSVKMGALRGKNG